ncbi:hypothetical protein LLE49_03890 [Alicyclobacillus tolerans]|uniref:hypothetical protein n=1 Tax=Alicyclobacillus tolerans TaxID=90970 RepID=UPI001F477211|nr:hypothetical protein [Alicyclobacillus tolerans]MCF8563882.1 hypothetical protein [Alicyclobacillus tolerans]
MFKFVLAMLIPLGVAIYTVQFGRWMLRKRLGLGAVSAFALAVATFSVSGVVLWRIFS